MKQNSTVELERLIDTREESLTSEQRTVVDKVTAAVDNNAGGFYFLDAPGGTGKTFTLNLILAKVRSQGRIALATASSGIAATLLEGGRTCHSTFKLPLNFQANEAPVCGIAKRSHQADLIRETRLIVIDECSMLHKRAFEAIDRSLRDLRNQNVLFGGVTVLIAGDFRYQNGFIICLFSLNH